MFKVLDRIAEEFNREDILWCVGASVMLSRHNMVETPNDIDIIVSVEDIHKVDSILKSMGRREECGRKEPFTTEYFYEYIIDGIEVDVMAGFGIKHEEGEYNFVFDKAVRVQNEKIINNPVPLAVLEDWYILYQVIPGREVKVKMIEDFLKKNGVDGEYLESQMKRSCLTDKIKKRTSGLI